MKKFINNPIFLCGHRKAGTTMLLCLLDSHPELLVYPADSGFFYAYYPRAEEKKYSNKNKIDTVINFCIKNLDLEIKNLSPKDKRNLTFSIDNFIKDFHKTLNKSDMSSKKILKAMIEAFAINTNQDINGIKYWVEKTTSTEIYATEIIKWFPRAKFIHLIRDPRDNWASLKSGWLKRYRHFNDSYLFLLQSMFERSKLGMEMAEHNKKIIGSRQYLIVKFEDLVTEPEKYLKKICKYLNINYKNSLQTPTILGKWWKGNNFDGCEFKGISNTNVGRWKKRITEKECHLIEYYFFDLMKKFDYKPVSNLRQRTQAVIKHYKWHNFAQVHSYKEEKAKKYLKTKCR